MENVELRPIWLEVDDEKEQHGFIVCLKIGSTCSCGKGAASIPLANFDNCKKAEAYAVKIARAIADIAREYEPKAVLEEVTFAPVVLA